MRYCLIASPFMPKIVSPQVEFAHLLAQIKAAAPEIFTHDGTSST